MPRIRRKPGRFRRAKSALTVSASASVRMQMSPATLKTTLAGGILERARETASDAVEQAHYFNDRCRRGSRAAVEVIYRSNQTDTLMVMATVKTDDASGASARALLAVTAVSTLLLTAHDNADPEMSANGLRIEDSSTVDEGSSDASETARSREPDTRPVRRRGRRIRKRRRTVAKRKPTGKSVAASSAAIRRRRRRRRRR